MPMITSVERGGAAETADRKAVGSFVQSTAIGAAATTGEAMSASNANDEKTLARRRMTGSPSGRTGRSRQLLGAVPAAGVWTACQSIRVPDDDAPDRRLMQGSTAISSSGSACQLTVSIRAT